MRNGSNRILDELAKLATDAADVAQGIRRDAGTAFRVQAEKIANKLDLVSREEFETFKEMVLKIHADNADLKRRLDDLEKDNLKKQTQKSKIVS
ncbi:accessory factor UbiK family protein [Bartonella sp. OT172YNZD]|uniref:accessory factor UbiK family protein n=1 Tax=Bartonella sp. OT172YNZD TaxID=3243572 RepID=UPI0035CEE7D6